MYLIKYYDCIHGDLTSVEPAERFDDAVASVLAKVGRSADYVITAGWTNGAGLLKIEEHGVTVASIELEPLVEICQDAVVITACNDLEQGDSSALIGLFGASPSAASIEHTRSDTSDTFIDFILPGVWETVEPNLYVKTYNDDEAYIEARTDGRTVRFTAKIACVADGLIQAVQQVGSAEAANSDQGAIDRAVSDMEVALGNAIGTVHVMFAVVAVRNGTFGYISGFSDRDRANIALAECMHADPLQVVRAVVWYATNGNIRMWQSLNHEAA